MFRKHFKKRFSNRETDDNIQKEWIENFAKTNKLKESEVTQLTQPFTESEFCNAINKLNPHSAPGPDGLSSNKYINNFQVSMRKFYAN